MIRLLAFAIGEALVTGLSTRGIPMPTVHCIARPPRSLMAQADPAVCDGIVAASSLVPEYAVHVDPQSAREILSARLDAARAEAEARARPAERTSAPAGTRGARRGSESPAAPADAGADLQDAARLGVRVLTSSTTNTILRGVFGILGGGSARSTRRRR